jgi:hypothetical protein
LKGSQKSLWTDACSNAAYAAGGAVDSLISREPATSSDVAAVFGKSYFSGVAV